MRADREKIISGVRNLGVTEGRGQVNTSFPLVNADHVT